MSRYARVFTRDRKNLVLLLAQAPILGLLAALIFPSGALDSVDRALDASNQIFLLTTIAVWLGAISASREIVRERTLLMRETAIGVRTSAYLASKLVVLGGLVTLQVTAMALCAFVLQPPDVGLIAASGMLACLLTSGWVAVTLGLMISAYATTENQATSLIPLTLIPQLLLGGAMVTVASMSAPMQGVASLVFTRWFFAGTGSAYDLSERIAEDPVFGAVNTYGGSFFSIPLTNVLAIGAAFAGGMLLVASLYDSPRWASRIKSGGAVVSPRQRRVLADWEAIRAEYSGHPAITVEPVGPAPPEEYVVTYRVSGLRREGDRPILAEEHEVRIQLPLDYPRQAPYCTPITPVFHPNIAEHVCIGDYWAAGERLVDVIAKVGEMLQYRLFNVNNPLDTVAAEYARENPELFPVGNVELGAPEIEIVTGGSQ